MEPIVYRGLLVGSNMGCYSRHSAQAAVWVCRYFPCKCPFPGSNRSLFQTRTLPFDSEKDGGHEQGIPDVLTDGTVCNVYEHLQILSVLFVQ